MFKKVILPALIISGSFLAAFGAIIAMQGTKLIEVRSDSEQVFYGKVRDVFSPTMGVLLSTGIGLAAWTAIGCGYSLKKSNDLEGQVTKLQQMIADREKQIQALKVEPSSPMMSSLKWFMEEESDKPQFQGGIETQDDTETQDDFVVDPTVPTVKLEVPDEPVVTATSGFEYEVIRHSQPAVQSAAFAFPAAQTGLGLAHKQVNSKSTQTS